MPLTATVYNFDIELVARLDRRLAFSVSIDERELYISIGSDTLTARVTKL